MISDRAISSRRHSPPETRLALVLRILVRPNWSSSSFWRSFRCLRDHVRARFEDRHQVVFDRQLPEDARILREIAHAGPGTKVHRQARDVATVEQDRAAIGVDQADRHPEAGCLAGAVGPEQPHDLAVLDLVVDAVDDLAAAVPLLQSADLQQGHRSILLDRVARRKAHTAGETPPASVIRRSHQRIHFIRSK